MSLRVQIPDLGSPDTVSLQWLSTVAAFVAAKDSTLTRIAFRSNCNALPAEVEARPAVNTGRSGLVAIPNTTRLKFRCTSGSTAASYQQLSTRNASTPPGTVAFTGLVANCRTSVYAVAVRGIVNVIHATAQNIMCNMTDEASADSYLGTVGATSTTNFCMKIGAAAAIDTGVAIGTLGTAEHDLIIWCDGTNIRGYIDLNPTAVATGLSNTAANNAGHVNTYAINNATAANTSHDILQWAVFVQA